MRVGVTGGAGFIGGHVVDRLLERGHTVVVFDRLGRPLAAPEGVSVMLGDTRDDTAVTEMAARVDGIIHLAAVLGTQETVANPRPAVMTNVISAMNVYEACVQYTIPAVNITVGNHWMSNPYSASKTCAETLGHCYVRDRGLALHQVRAVNAYGPRQVPAKPYGPSRVRKIMPAFVCRALTGAPIEVYGDGQQVSDMVSVRDVTRALVAALELAATGTIIPTVMECGPAEHHTVLRVADLVAKAAADRGHPQAGIRHLPMRPGETPGARIVADPTTLAPLGLSDADLLPLEQGIAEVVDWYADHWLPNHIRQVAA